MEMERKGEHYFFHIHVILLDSLDFLGTYSQKILSKLDEAEQIVHRKRFQIN